MLTPSPFKNKRQLTLTNIKLLNSISILGMFFHLPLHPLDVLLTTAVALYGSIAVDTAGDPSKSREVPYKPSPPNGEN